MTGFDVGGRLPIFGRVVELTPGAIVLLVVLLVAAAAVVVLVVRARMSGARKLELTVKASVAEKREAKGGAGDCFVTFNLPERETMTLKLTASQASLLREGQAGELTVKGGKFVSFQ